MLQIYILRSRQIIEEKDQPDEDYGEELELEGAEEESKDISVTNLFENLLRFWRKCKEIGQ